MRGFLLLVVLILAIHQSFAQENKVIDLQERQQAAYTLRKKGKFEEALAIHKYIYDKAPTYKMNTYNYACLYGLQENKDSCLKYLNLSLATYLGLQPLVEPDLYFLHNDSVWRSIEDTLFSMNEYKVRRIKDFEYAKTLYQLAAADQALYTELEIAKFKYGHNSKHVKDIWTNKESIYLKIQKKFTQLIDKKGWPKRSIVGLLASNSASSIIQHANLELMKKYIPTLKKLCNEGEGSCPAYAMMFDRIRVRSNKAQRYGTQVRYNDLKELYELYPLENEGQLHEYREWAGLPPIEDYVKYWNIEVDIKKKRRDFAYADSLVSAKLNLETSEFKVFHGSDFKDKTKPPLSPNHSRRLVQMDPKCILGAEEDGCLTMPKGTEVTIMFTDNQIVNYPDQPDIYVKELMGADDKAVVFVSNDGLTFDSLGITFDGRASSLDLEDIKYPKSVKFIKIISLDNNGALPGYDLIYIKGLPGSNIDTKMTKPEIKKYLLEAKKEVERIQRLSEYEPLKELMNRVLKQERNEHKQAKVLEPKAHKLVLEEIRFDTRSTKIQERSYPYLYKLVKKLKEKDWQLVELTGHTDNRGSAASNKALSLNRAEAIKQFLRNQGVKKGIIRCIGMGATQPLSSNETKDGRANNRRVEFRLVN